MKKLMDRLDSFREMQDGWLDGEGNAPSHALIEIVKNCMTERFSFTDETIPCAYPTEDGGILIEHFKGTGFWHLSIDFHQGGSKISFSGIRVDPQDDSMDCSLFVEGSIDSVCLWEYIMNSMRYCYEEQIERKANHAK